MKYCKKPVVIDAWSVRDLLALADGRFGEFPLQIKQATIASALYFKEDHILVKTLEGDHRADIDDMIICGVKGELYPCKPNIFALTYDAVNEDAFEVAPYDPSLIDCCKSLREGADYYEKQIKALMKSPDLCSQRCNMNDSTAPNLSTPPPPDHRMSVMDEGVVGSIAGMTLDYTAFDPTLRVTITGGSQSGKTLAAVIIARSLRKNLLDMPGKLHRPMKVLIETKHGVTT